MFFKIGALNNFAIFTEAHLCWSLFFKTLQVKLFTKKLRHRCKSSLFNKARLVVASEEPMEFSIYLKNRLLPNMFASWLPQIMLLFLSSLLKFSLVMLYCYLLQTTVVPATNSSPGGFTQDWGKACGK